MSSCSTSVATEVDEFRAALRPGDGEVTVTARGRFEATVVRVTFDHSGCNLRGKPFREPGTLKYQQTVAL